jgi:DNA repair exonuclease SbcCD ATPase subunit
MDGTVTTEYTELTDEGGDHSRFYERIIKHIESMQESETVESDTVTTPVGGVIAELAKKGLASVETLEVVTEALENELDDLGYTDQRIDDVIDRIDQLRDERISIEESFTEIESAAERTLEMDKRYRSLQKKNNKNRSERDRYQRLYNTLKALEKLREEKKRIEATKTAMGKIAKIFPAPAGVFPRKRLKNRLLSPKSRRKLFTL